MEIVAEPNEYQGRCRICLEEFIDSPIKPCNCSSGLFHKECLEEWVKVSQKKNCEVCLQEYNCLKEVIVYSKEHIISFTLIYFVAFSMIGVIIYVLDRFFLIESALKIVLYVLIVIAFFSLIFFSFFFLNLQNYFFEKKIVSCKKKINYFFLIYYINENI